MAESRGNVYLPIIATFQRLLIMPAASVIRPYHGKLMFHLTDLYNRALRVADGLGAKCWKNIMFNFF